ncbi:hypothetical protein DFJ58DRAFT_847033 [Suillus subalutaceus]|uniref:uncharacterized protein n=1 Tax=Suillus subalutaceus TaxID=48586 RepID=UPI001B87A300|nr:uncharacterized protein DFJ58DRAFT_847033 [Suillus subalutaceus]KAG1836266.1 hypothetical protein DFJ58DRAFT_847033 [Suillus subalutaceus]
MPIVVSDNESTSGHVVSRPQRTVTLSSRLTDANNDVTSELSAHRNKPPMPAISTPTPVPTSGTPRSPTPGVMENGPHTRPLSSNIAGKRLRHSASANGEASFTDASSPSVIDTAEETLSICNATPMDTEGFLSDINEKSCDVSAFFGQPYAHKAKDGKTHAVQDCEPCKKNITHAKLLATLQRVNATLPFGIRMPIDNGAKLTTSS